MAGLSIWRVEREVPRDSPLRFEVTAFNIGGMDVPEVKAMVELYPVGQICDNHVYPGVLHNAFMDVGIPSFTPEICAARVLDPEMISLFVEGTINVLKHHGIVAGPDGTYQQGRDRLCR